MSLSHIRDNNNYWTVIVNTNVYQFDQENCHYDELVRAISEENVDVFLDYIARGEAIKKWSDGDFQFEQGVLLYNGSEVEEVITDRIIQMMKEEFDHKPLLRFLERLYQNPSYRAVTELYKFLMHKYLPITNDGMLLAYKAVAIYYGVDFVNKDGITVSKGDYVDKYTRQIRNNVGDTPSMLRFKVQDNCTIPCDHGLHLGAASYAENYANNGDALIICRVDPMNVVSIPEDSQYQKMRCCGYEVVGVYKERMEKAVHDEYDDEDDQYEEYEEEEDEEDMWGRLESQDEDDDEDDDEDKFTSF